MKPKNASLPKLKLDTELDDLIHKALNKINNSTSRFEITLPIFRRMALKDYASRVLSDGLDLKFKPE